MAAFRQDVLNEQKVKEIIEYVDKCKVEQLIKCSIKAGCAEGENFVGDLAEVDVQASLSTDIENQIKSYRWMVKLTKPPKPGMPDIMGELNLFEREGHVYANIVSKYLELESDSLPVCNFVYRQQKPQPEMIVLDHMAQYGFEGGRKKRQGLDRDHCGLVVQWLARFHALGHVVMSRHPGGKEAWREDSAWATPLELSQSDQMEAMAEAFKENGLKTMLDGAAAFQGDQDYVGRLERIGAKYNNRIDKFTQESYTARRPFQTLLHGDPWFNNMLFKYSEGGKVEKALLLDMQACCLAHPGVDLAYFFISSTTQKLRKEHLDSLLKLYLATLLDTARSHGAPIRDYSLEDLKEDYRVGMKKGFIFALGLVPFMMRESHEVEKMSFEKEDKDFTDPEVLTAIYKETQEMKAKIMKNNPAVKARMRGTFEDMIEAGWL